MDWRRRSRFTADSGSIPKASPRKKTPGSKPKSNPGSKRRIAADNFKTSVGEGNGLATQ
jgi:hypothetical protein